MDIAIGPETRKLLEDRMKLGRYSSEDELLRLALLTLDEVDEGRSEDLDPETVAAIERAAGEFDRGESVPWESVRDDLRAKFGIK